jgi:hypothetical protein
VASNHTAPLSTNYVASSHTAPLSTDYVVAPQSNN